LYLTDSGRHVTTSQRYYSLLKTSVELKQKVSCTSMPCTWNQPRKRKLSPRRIEDMTPVKHIHGKEERKVAVPKDGVYTPSLNVDGALFLDSCLGSLASVNPDAAICTVYKP